MILETHGTKAKKKKTQVELLHLKNLLQGRGLRRGVVGVI
jgi:hypothetical protein